MRIYLKLAIAGILAATSIASAVAQNTAITFDPAGPGTQSIGPSLTLSRVLPTEQRELSVAEAKKLLSSTEGPAWRMLAVTAPQCTDTKKDLKKKKAKKVEVKQCQQYKADCAKAAKFAKANGLPLACSTLYTLTTVQLATKPVGVK